VDADQPNRVMQSFAPRKKGDLPDLRSGLHTSPLYYKVAPNIHNLRLTRTLYCETNQPLALADMSKVTTSWTSHNSSSSYVQSTENEAPIERVCIGWLEGYTCMHASKRAG
jgi:hypothetical protein